MKIAITGSSGFVGSHLARALRLDGHTLVALKRDDFTLGVEPLSHLIDGCQVVINLAGEPINRRWTASYKKRIVSSRVDTTHLLVEAMALLDQPPQTLVSTSAIGAYDVVGRYSEADPANATDFLGQLSEQWEQAASSAEALGVRVLIFRFGLVLGHDGGLMKQLLIPFTLGLGGPVGDGSQHFSWIHIDDLVQAYRHALGHEEMAGMYHLCAPNPVSNREFTRELAGVVKRPAFIPVPALLLKMLFGEGAEVMTSGQWVVSERLPESGFSFEYPELTNALKAIVKKAHAASFVLGLLGTGASR